jgi:HK97 family phage portal protein
MNEETKDTGPQEDRASMASTSTWLNNNAGGRSASGKTVNPNTGLTFTAVYAAIRVLAESIASLPLKVYRRDGEAAMPADTHPVYRLLHQAPSSEQSTYSWRETIMGHVLTYGNGYSEIIRNGAGMPVAIYPIHPERVQITRIDERLVYVYTHDADQRAILSDDVIHIAGLGFDGLQGYSPIRLFREAIGMGLAAEEFGSSFFGNAARPSGVLSHPGQLSQEAAERLRDSWGSMHRGANKAGKVAILEEGMRWDHLSIPPNDAQFLESRAFQVREIARIYRVPPHLLADLEGGASFASIEQMSMDFLRYSLRPWLVRWEQELMRKLLADDGRHYIEHSADALLRGDTTTRFNAYKIGREGGWLSVNDIRRLEGMNMVGGGDSYLQPLNMTEIGSGEMLEEPDMLERSAPTALGPIIGSTARRLAKVEAQALTRAIKKHLEGAEDGVAFLQWADEYYRKHAEVIADAYTSVIESLMVLDGRAGDAGVEAKELAAFVVSDSMRGLAEIITESETVTEAAGELRRIASGLPDASPKDIETRLIGRQGGNDEE